MKRPWVHMSSPSRSPLPPPSPPAPSDCCCFFNWLLLCPKDPVSAYPRRSWRESRKAWFELAVPVSPRKLCEKGT